jgi:hypothetical protein
VENQSVNEKEDFVAEEKSIGWMQKRDRGEE